MYAHIIAHCGRPGVVPLLCLCLCSIGVLFPKVFDDVLVSFILIIYVR